MHSLLSNNCVKYLNVHENTDVQSGEIGFYGGELYEGELEYGKPRGWGVLHLPDGSYYEGNFDTNGITDGRLVMPNGDYFDGKFLKDKMHKGTIWFRDGDSLEGEWGLLRMKWNLKYGCLKNENKKILFDFRNEISSLTKQSKDKEICRRTDRELFEVRYAKCKLATDKEAKNFAYNANGRLEYDSMTNEGAVENIRRDLTGPFPSTVIEHYQNGSLVKSVYKSCFGFEIERSNHSKDAKATFIDLKNIQGIGLFMLEKSKLKFKGKLNYKDIEIGLVSIKKASLTDIRIKHNEVEFKSMNEFCEHIGVYCKDKFDDPDVYVCVRRQTKNKIEAKPEVMDDVINGIKEHNNCVIM